MLPGELFSPYMIERADTGEPLAVAFEVPKRLISFVRLSHQLVFDFRFCPLFPFLARFC